jgi:hypothetical protein
MSPKNEKKPQPKTPEQEMLTDEDLDSVAGGMLACAPPTTTSPEPVVIQGGTYTPRVGGG